MNTRNLCLFVFLFITFGVAHSLTPVEAGEFIVGFGAGIAIEVPKNISQCVNDTAVTLTDFETGFSLVDEGIKDLSVKKVEEGLKLLGSGTKEIGQVLSYCGIEAEGQKILNLGEQILEGKIFSVIIHTVIDILYHEKTVKEDLQNATAAWNSGDYFDSGKYYGEVITIIVP